MFKNESNELLLARVDALAKSVRQRKYQASQQDRLDQLVDVLAGATVVVDTDDRLSYVSEQACSLLGFDSRASLLGQSAKQVLDLDKLRDSPSGKYRAQWRDSAQGPVNVVYRQILLAENNDIVVNFKRLPAASERPAAVVSAETADPLPVLTKTQAVTAQDATAQDANSQQQASVNEEALPSTQSLEYQDSGAAVNTEFNIEHLPDSCSDFVKALEGYTTQSEVISDHVSILMLDLFAAEPGKDFVPTNQYNELPATLEKALKDIYKREHHVAHFGANRYGLILRYTTQPQAYLLTRKIMQQCNEIDIKQQVLTINSTGCLYGITSNKGKSATQVLSLASQGLDVVNQRGRNQALLLDLRRMLPVYASQNPN